MKPGLSIGVIAIFAGLPAAVWAAPPTPGHPLGNPAEWVTPDDYPLEALRDGVEGTTGFKVSYDRAGAVTDCVIIASSGSAALDETTCYLMRRRARFQPGSDTNRQPAPGTYASRVRWSVPARQLPGAVMYKVAQDFNAAGEFEKCQVLEAAGIMPEDKDKICQRAPRPPRPEIFRDANGKPVAYTVISAHSVQFQPRDTPPR